MQHFKITAKGRVQGVYFRAFTLKVANKYSIFGTSKNLNNGDVEIIASGSAQNMSSFIQACKSGPLLANVNKLIVIEHPCSTPVFTDFKIIS